MKAAWIGTHRVLSGRRRVHEKISSLPLVRTLCGQHWTVAENAENTENTERERRGAKFRHASMILDDLPAQVADQPLSPNLNPLFWSSNT